MAGGRSANLSVDVVANTRDAQADLDRFSSKVAGMAAGIAASVTSAGIDLLARGATFAASELVDAVGEAASLNAALATTQKIYGAATDSIVSWAKAADRALGLSQVEALAAARSFSTFGKIAGYTGEDLALFSKDATTVAADLGAFADLPTAQAVEAIGSAFRKERDPLEKFGIILSDAQVKAAYFRATGEEVTGTLTDQQNVIGTWAAITEQAAVAQGQFADESGELAGQQQIAAAGWDNMKASIGEVFLPAVTGALTFINEELIPGLQDLGRWLGESETGKAIMDFARWVKDEALEARKGLEDWIRGPGAEALKMFADDLAGMAGDIRNITDDLKDLKRAIDDSTRSIGGLSGMIGVAFAASLQGLAFAIKAALGQLQLMIALLRLSWEWFTRLLSVIGNLIGKIGEMARLNLPNILGPLGGLAGMVVGASAPAGGPSTRSGAGTVYAPVFNITATVPPGVYAGDVGAAIVDTLKAWEARNGPVPLGGIG